MQNLSGEGALEAALKEFLALYLDRGCRSRCEARRTKHPVQAQFYERNQLEPRISQSA